MRCKNCQKLGHTKNRCRNVEICKECGELVSHSNCERKFCVTCNVESHTSYDNTCPSFMKHKAVLKIKINRRCTIREAWKTYNTNPEAHQIFSKNNPKPTFANVTKKTNNTTTEKEIENVKQSKNTQDNKTSPKETEKEKNYNNCIIQSNKPYHNKYNINNKYINLKYYNNQSTAKTNNNQQTST